MTLDVCPVASFLDLSAVQANSTLADVRELADLALQYRGKAVFSLPTFTSWLKDYRSEKGGTFLIGGPVGFPSGGMTTSMKVREAEELLILGADEIDMMINIGMLLSGMHREAQDDIAAVKQAIGSTTLKVIIECHYLDRELTERAAAMVVQGGAEWIKTGTGWTPSGATLENVALLKQLVGDSVKVKAAGGVRDLDTIEKMMALGVERFGVGGKTAHKILHQLHQVS